MSELHNLLVEIHRSLPILANPLFVLALVLIVSALTRKPFISWSHGAVTLMALIAYQQNYNLFGAGLVLAILLLLLLAELGIRWATSLVRR